MQGPPTPKSCLQPGVDSQSLSHISSNLLAIFTFQLLVVSPDLKFNQETIQCPQRISNFPPSPCDAIASPVISLRPYLLALQVTYNMSFIPLSLHGYPSSGSYDFMSALGSSPHITPPHRSPLCSLMTLPPHTTANITFPKH